MPLANFQENVLPLESGGRAVTLPHRSIGSILIADGKLSEQNARRVVELQRAEGIRFGEAALRLGLISEGDLRQALARQYDFPHLPPDHDGVSTELVAAHVPFHRRVEELRALRTQLLIRWFNATVPRRRMLAVVSPGSEEGRSYVAANLALVFSQLGGRTLLIDADLRRPRQHKLFNVPDHVGLSTVLSGRADHGAAVPVNGFGGLWLLPAGAVPPNPQELLSRPALTALIAEVQSLFDVILFDTPPAKLYADMQNVTSQAGGAIVLARKNHSRIADVRDVIRDVTDSGAQVVGSVANTF
jgi:receptor protein-tyrosine kinase